MPRCPRCATDSPAETRFCHACGASLLAPTSTPTRTSLQGQEPTQLLHGSSVPANQARSRFTPGDLLANRYRITTLLGQGGMGEVYRADDLKLGQPVALKFLPAELEQDASRLERLLNEVRAARQVAHPNVCRMYDVAEVGQQHFLSMEYVDGEDLASLLTRIGRLPEDKATQLSRQLCAGLAAAHQQGILHRDLKPANVMVDGKGRARITDFGLAGLAGSFEGADIRAGTPAYMAPEQLDGREVTERSDIYGLGLVLYELFTGEPAFPATSFTQLHQLRRDSTPTSPSSHIAGLDPAIERVILRCLDPDPAQRPASALAVSAALPGGDPLAEALAAGETPSPEMVAAAGDVGGLRPATGIALFCAALVGLLAIVATHKLQFLPGQLDFPEPADALRFKARQIIEDAGYPDPPTDRAHGFVRDTARLQHAREHEGATGDWSTLYEDHPGPVTFWYRQSPRYMNPTDFDNMVVTEIDPGATVAGMVSLRMDPQGRLTRFQAVPAPPADTDAPASEPDWSAFFEHAALDPQSMTATAADWLPPVFCDRQLAWSGSFSDQPEIPVRVEAGAYRGRPVYFELVPPWTRPQQTMPEPTPAAISIVAFGLLLFLLGAAVLLARHNLRLGRGDRRGAFRLAAFMFACNSLVAIFGAHHTPTFAITQWFFKTMAWGLMISGMVWIVYLALEPYARRLWPDILISWSRLLAGRLRDPLIGRDLLIGGVFGVASVLITRLTHVLPPWLDLPAVEPISGPMGGYNDGALTSLDGIRQALGMIGHIPAMTLSSTLAGVFLLVLMRMILRKPWIAVGATFLVLFLISLTVMSNPVVDVPVYLINQALYVFVLIRFGLLASGIFLLLGHLDPLAMLTTDFSDWYAGRSWLLVGLVVALFVYALWIAVGRRRWLSRPS